MSYSEIAACLAYAVSVWLAARNNVHTWWIGIIGSILYGWVFWSVQLYADVTLQLFFIATSITGWIHWLKGQGGDILPVRRTQASHFFLLLLCAVVVAGGYGFLLHTFTNAWAPWQLASESSMKKVSRGSRFASSSTPRKISSAGFTIFISYERYIFSK